MTGKKRNGDDDQKQKKVEEDDGERTERRRMGIVTRDLVKIKVVRKKEQWNEL